MHKGRSSELIELRNKALVRQFYKLFDVQRMRMDDVLIKLEREHFFIDRKTIYAIIFYDPQNKEFYQNLIEKNDTQLKMNI